MLFYIFSGGRYMPYNSPTQALIPLLSPFGEKIEFWIEPFDSSCKQRFFA